VQEKFYGRKIMPNVTVGCDPEFLLLDSDGHLQNVSIDHDCEQGNIGYDHGCRVGELRPKYGTPQQVTNNIRILFKELKRRYPAYKVAAGGGEKYGFSIGGHIHFGNIHFNNYYSSSTRQSNRGRVNPLLLNPENKEHKLIFMLDYFLGRRLKKVPGGQRPKSATYGRLSDVETKVHGFEYRTPPSWLTDPVLTESTLTIAYQITAIWKDNPTFFDDIIRRNKNIARRKEYALLIPRTGVEKTYVATQIANFKRLAFSKSYRMDNDNCLETWTSSAEQISTTVQTISNKILLTICQIKLVQQQESFPTETVVKVCRFEVKIFAYQNSYHITSRLRLKEQTIYISKNLRPYLKVKRGHQFKVKFVNGIETNAVLFYDVRANGILNEIIRIFETGARKKLRRADSHLQTTEQRDSVGRVI
jgi:hypothetical protein